MEIPISNYNIQVKQKSVSVQLFQNTSPLCTVDRTAASVEEVRK